MIQRITSVLWRSEEYIRRFLLTLLLILTTGWLVAISDPQNTLDGLLFMGNLFAVCLTGVLFGLFLAEPGRDTPPYIFQDWRKLPEKTTHFIITILAVLVFVGGLISAPQTQMIVITMFVSLFFANVDVGFAANLKHKKQEYGV